MTDISKKIFNAFRLKVDTGFKKKGTLKQKTRAFKFIYLKKECSNTLCWALVLFIITLANAAQAETTSQKWTCPMHPHYIADEFGSCPICGMELVKLQTIDQNQTSSNDDKKPVITIPSETIQKMGVRIAKVEPSKFGKKIRSFGIVTENERLQLELSARVEGWIETLKITAVGDEVKEGDLLFEMFSPELIVSQRDFLLAQRQSKPSQINIKKRLVSFGVQQKALDLIAKKSEVQQNVPFFATQNGTIAELNVAPGTYVNKGMTIAKIQDYSTVWIIVNVSEKDLSFINKGTRATVHFPNLPGTPLTTTVDYIYPKVNETTRTGRVRLILENKEGTLRPGTYADIIFETKVEERLSIPSEAILKDQTGSYVVTSLGQGKFQSRPVELGLVTGGRSEIKSGLKTGEKIVISSQFLIDSESTLRESFNKLERLQSPLNQLNLSKTDQAKFDHMIDAALYIHEALTQNFDIDEKFIAPAVSIKTLLWEKYKDTKLEPILTNTHSALKQAQMAKTKSELKEALNSLTKSLEPWLFHAKPDDYKSKGITHFKTAQSNQRWLQLGHVPLNPYNLEKAPPTTWPKIMQTKAKKDPEADKKNQSPRGSHSMRGSGHDHE